MVALMNTWPKKYVRFLVNNGSTANAGTNRLTRISVSTTAPDRIPAMLMIRTIVAATTTAGGGSAVLLPNNCGHPRLRPSEPNLAMIARAKSRYSNRKPTPIDNRPNR